jgi:hypothetical protein
MGGAGLIGSKIVEAFAAHYRANDLTFAMLVIALALSSFWRPLKYAHLAIAGVALWLIGHGYLAALHPAPLALQNGILVGWLLLMLAIIPNEASYPQKKWIDFQRRKESTS